MLRLNFIPGAILKLFLKRNPIPFLIHLLFLSCTFPAIYI
ncbi:hypothetical protein RUMGNA_02176 [Mediterraneibacter gnavus ATCC 29149]|uniref:Uncharacterized protein n=1 Tax=Mediterraneibacter gnavus (strain ATCC 29149 / DSM 114966 / JCM 6515 / VPI C7-9) TaxID=411470 RepID=A7B3P7_MEDG7|nr:hypothetical protein RUMGNA_02176 [Mediterraneibacter gnavus ATCC 29149]